MEGEKMAYKMMNQDFVKLDKFDGSNFIRWQDKMKFLLTALKIFYVLDPNLQPIPDPTPQDTEQLKQQRIKREEDELVCRGHILNTLSDRLYDLFTTMTSPKEIWKALETKYKTEKQGTDKFIIQKYFDFKMMDNQKNSSEWWYDSGATIHVCNNKMLFKEYVEAGNGLEVLMGNHNTAKVLGTGTVELILSSGKKLKLTNVYHVPDIKKNLVSASLLSKNGVKAVLESDKLILSKFGNVEEDLNTYSEVMASRDAAFWREAVNDEIDSILSNNTWVLVDLPPVGGTSNGCKDSFLNGDLDEEVYMDQPEGFVLPGNEKKVCVCETKKYLASVFKMKDLNEADTILGIKVKRHSEGYALCQNHYIEKLEFASAIRSMMYVMHCTRPDIAFAVNRLSRYTSNPNAEHWKAIARVLGYLKKTKDLGLYYSGYPTVLEGYSDANWVTSVGDNKSTSGWIFTLGGLLVQYHGHLKSNRVSLIQLWNLSLLLWLRQDGIVQSVTLGG
uniref:Retrovirus-related Pol polyprotein from transposon TNT 1-94-like beta-barrel domain-containing protein n=1 Tax=Fagus sylvatica TaxID=28930 RepID=A0A2N9EDW1_FAGSY